MRFEFPAAGVKTRDIQTLPISLSREGELWLPTYRGDAQFWERLLSRPVSERLAKLEVRAVPGRKGLKPRSVRVYLLPTREAGYRIVGRAY